MRWQRRCIYSSHSEYAKLRRSSKIQCYANILVLCQYLLDVIRDNKPVERVCFSHLMNHSACLCAKFNKSWNWPVAAPPNGALSNLCRDKANFLFASICKRFYPLLYLNKFFLQFTISNEFQKLSYFIILNNVPLCAVIYFLKDLMWVPTSLLV